MHATSRVADQVCRYASVVTRRWRNVFVEKDWDSDDIEALYSVQGTDETTDLSPDKFRIGLIKESSSCIARPA